MDRRVILLAADIMLPGQVRGLCRDRELPMETFRDAEQAAEACDESTIAIIDLTVAGAADLVHRASSAGAKVYAFGPHVQADLLRGARGSGASEVVVKSQLASKLPDWLGLVD